MLPQSWDSEGLFRVALLWGNLSQSSMQQGFIRTSSHWIQVLSASTLDTLSYKSSDCYLAYPALDRGHPSLSWWIMDRQISRKDIVRQSTSSFSFHNASASSVAIGCVQNLHTIAPQIYNWILTWQQFFSFLFILNKFPSFMFQPSISFWSVVEHYKPKIWDAWNYLAHVDGEGAPLSFLKSVKKLKIDPHLTHPNDLTRLGICSSNNKIL